MAASDTDLILNLLLYATTQDANNPSSVLSAMVVAAGAGFATGGGRILNASTNGKAFSFQLDPRLSLSDLITALRGALALAASNTPQQLTALLYTPASSVGYIRFGGC